ncbi:Vacuolar membrane-associated protein iml1 [Lachnellula suecica]|uniref:Vacuolar membrane-associated protein IML1 n=1 Tax=Lachnellula suecica TaxID=602035 RepID=A0A8T9CM76_9HELO|nr:Vacuolar membrane-associated protein iml1 [Lachnellula suecica]
MVPIPPTAPRRGPQKTSHLRHVSNGSTEAAFNSRPVTAASEKGTAQHDTIPVKLPTERKCTLWVHEETFSKDDVVLDLDLFPDVKPGELLGVVALRAESGVHDFQDKVPTPRKDGDNLSAGMQRQRSSDSTSNGTNIGRDPENGKRYLFTAQAMTKEMKAKHPTLEMSVAKHVADIFCLKHRSQVLVSTVDSNFCSASHVELCFKDEYLSRSDMWRLTLGELSNKTVFKGQKILFMGTIKAQVTAIYVDGCKVQSAFFSTSSKPIFRSESARYVLFIQMSKEMWDFDSEGSGEIMFNKVVNGFLPALFKKWASLKAKHLVSIVLFTRVEYDTGIASELATSTHDLAYHTGIQAEGSKKPYKDFYRVVVSEMASGSWTTILYNLKREFKFFRRDISMHRVDIVTASAPAPKDANMRGPLGTRIEAEPSLAMHGNVLEAINLASSQFAHDYIDRDLMRTGISVVVITPSPGLFEVDYETLKMTTEALIGNGIGIDLVCLPKMPLHSVPLFRYRNPQYSAFQEAIHMKSLRSEDSTPRQTAPVFGSSFSSLNESLSPLKASMQERSLRAGSIAAASPPSEWSYAIPHWIDVSFWTGASQDIGLGNSSAESVNKHLRREHALPARDFEVRCKMYEMEMASMKDNVLTEISVTPLQHDALFSQMIIGPRIIPGTIQDQKTDSGSVEREKVASNLSEFVAGPSKSLLDRHSSSQERNLYKALEEFDLSMSEIPDEYPATRRNVEGKRYLKTGSEEAAKRILAADAKVFGTSFKENLHTFKGPGIMGASIPRNDEQNPKDTEDRTKPRKESVSNATTTSTKMSPLRPPKFGRQISLGKHGFGIAAPKAATAEIQTENASAARPNSATTNISEPKKSTTSTMANRLLSNTAVQTQDRPPSSQSQKSTKQSGTPPLEPKTDIGEADKASASRPMTIKSALQSLDSTNQFKSRSMLGSLFEGSDGHGDGENAHNLQSKRADAQKLYNSKLLAEAVPELPAVLSPTTALSPWLSVLNPSNPSANDELKPSQYRRWQHVFPRPVHTKTMKWKSLCSPASVPLTTEYFPTKIQLDTEYEQKPYNISQNTEDELNEVPKSREDFLRELIGLRLSQGFQIVVGSAVADAFGQKSLKLANVFDPDRIAEDGASVFMSMGSIIHKLSCVNEGEVEVNMFVRKPTASTASNPGSGMPTVYYPAIRTTLAENYESRSVMLGRPREEYNWNYVDAFIAGFDDEMSESLRFWRARFVLIPVERPTQLQRRQGEDNEEEVRLEGIKKLTQLWQRHRVITPSERRFQSLAARKTKDQNPLDIVYKTEDPSVVVTAELETLPLVELGESGMRRGQLIETERFRRAKLDIAALAEAIQAPVERGGVRMQNRRWHFRLHYNCFIGSDMTTWLIENFEDIDTREEAVELGNFFMANDEMQRIREKEVPKENAKEKDKDMGIFVHVEKRHPFRDGQYFYQVTGEHAKQRPESRSGWFGSRRRDNSIPSTPMSEGMPRPERSRSSSNYDEKSSDSGATTPTTIGGKKPKVALSKVMKYDVDHRHRSYRPERINLHYDRLHNPDNCYHIRIDWVGVTAKLIEDAIESWARTAEGFGLRLVEAPIGEACSITSVHPFRSPYAIELAVQPPDQQPTTYFDINSFTPQAQSTPANRHYYQKAIMKKFNFVLDIEAARNFPSNVDVTYSWGKPDFKYTQYIHRSGVLLAQITDEGNFLLLANRLYNNRTAAARESDRYVKIDHERSTRVAAAVHGHGINTDKPSPFNSPLLRPTNSLMSPIMRATSDVLGGSSLAGSKNALANLTTPEAIKNELEAFCGSAQLLEAFYKEVYERATPTSAPTPVLRSPYVGSLLESNIPTLGLPPGVLARDTSPSPMRLSSLTGIGSSMPSLGRRQSVQPGPSGDAAKQGSPRGSIAESDKAL